LSNLAIINSAIRSAIQAACKSNSQPNRAPTSFKVCTVYWYQQYFRSNSKTI